MTQETKAMDPGVVLVTGAAHRIGRAIALALAEAGWAVAAHYHQSRDAAESLVEQIAGSSGRAVALPANLAQEAEAAALIGQAANALGPLTCLVNNAAAFEHDDVETVTRATWDAHMETNLRAPFLLTQAFAAQLPAQAQGCVINMLDQRVWNLTPHFVSYTVSKAALWALTQSLAFALAPRIRVNGIGPGPALPSARQSDEDFARQWASMPLGRGTTPEEIASAVQFILASPALTGQMLALDGGQHLGWAQPQQKEKPKE